MLLPEPPLHSSIDETTQLVVTVFMGVVAAATLIFSLIYWKRTGRPTFLLLFVAGGAMMLFEPVVDTVGACWFPEGNSWVAFTAYGRPIPLWLCFTYFFYFGIGVGVTWLILRRGITRKQMWGLFAVLMLGDFILETVLLVFDTWFYYGPQPLLIGKYPLWAAAVNAFIVIAAAAAVYVLDDYLKGWRQLLIVPVAVTASAFGNAAVGWPAWFVINTDVPWGVRQLGGIACFTLAFWLMDLIVRVTIPEEGSPEAISDRLGLGRGTS